MRAAQGKVRVSQRAHEVSWSGIRKMFELALKAPEAVNLSAGEPSFDTPKHIIDAAKWAMDNGYTHYPPCLGFLDLREAIAKKLASDNKIEADPESEMIVVTGGIEGLFLSLSAIIDPGDEVLIPDPGYPNYEGAIEILSGVPVRIPVREENEFRVAAADVRKAITKRTRALMLNSPANPTGAVMLRPDLEAIASVAREYDLFVVSDEAYEKLIYDGLEHISIATLPGMKERTASVFTFSKTYAMTGWRIGYVVGPESLIDQMHKLQESVVSTVNAPAQKAAKIALEASQDCVAEMRAAYGERRQFVVEALNSIPRITCVAPKGAFYAFPNITGLGRRSLEVARFLLTEAGVVTVPGTAFGPRGEGYLRLSYASSMENLEEAMKRVAEGLVKLYQGMA